MPSKQEKPEVSIDAIKELVKRYQKSGFEALTHHDLALALSTIGFQEVCKEFGATWTTQHEKQALKILASSQYDLSWFGKSNNSLYASIIPLALRGDIEKIKDLIRTVNRDMKPQLHSTVDNFKRTPLHLAVKENFDILAEYLINEGFSVNARDRQLKTPLHCCRSELICYVLLKNEASVIARDNKNCTPAHYAATSTEFKVLEAMLKKTNVVNEVDSTLKSPIFYAVFNTSEEQINILRILVQNGAKINEKDLYGKTPLHYAAQMGKSRCIPFLLQKGASLDIRDKHNKTPLDLCQNQKVRKLLTVYSDNKGIITDKEEKQKRQEYSKIGKSRISDQPTQKPINQQIYSQELNQVSTWVREKFFVLMKKLQESGVKAMWHVKRPYIYTGSWAEDIDSLEDLFETFVNVNGPEAAMRSFNILCPYQKPLPTVIGKSEQAFQSFFGENWFSNDPVEKVRNMHSQAKIRTELQSKTKEAEDLKTQLLGYRSEIEKLESILGTQKQELNQYKKVEDELRKERAKNTQQYSEILELMSEKQELKNDIENLIGGQEKTKILSTMVDQLRSKNEDLSKQIEHAKVAEAAARRKCGQIFLKSLTMAAEADQFKVDEQNNLYDDDAIISLYDALKGNPPNLQTRFRKADKRNAGKLTIDEFTLMLEQLHMLPQDVMSMHRITGFAFGRKTLSLDEFKTLLENRHKNRPMWEKKLIRKMKTIILQNSISLENFFALIDKDGNGTIEASELRKGLQNYNIFMNQNDWSNLFNLLDSDKSGEIDLSELKTLMEQERTGKLEIEPNSIIQQPQEEEAKIQQKHQPEQEQEQQQQQEQEKQQEQQKQKESQKKSSSESEDEILKELEEQEKFEKEEYSQKDSEDEGFIKLNGEVKAQLPIIKFPEDTKPEKVWIRFCIADFQTVKMADLSLPKLAIAIKFEMIEYKIMSNSDLKMFISVFTSRQFDQENYMGECEVEMGPALEKPNQWAVNGKYRLEAEEFEKEVSGVLVLQAKWIPGEDE